VTWSGTELPEAYSAAVGSRTPGNRRVTQSVKSLGTDGRSYQWSGGRDCPRAGSDALPPRAFDTECPPQSRLFRRPLATTLLALWLAKGVLCGQETAASKVQAG
jgi:hypothetical protein